MTETGQVPMTEARLLRHVKLAALMYGYLCYHTRLSIGSDKGFPDLELVRRDPPSHIYAELKSERGRLTPDQREWIETLRAVGRTVYVWRPDDLDEIHRILKGDDDA